MSAYSETAVKDFKDGELLIQALEEMGFKPVNCIGKPQHLEGYQGDKREQTADIIIPRKQVGGAANDIGFVRKPDGTYTAIISEYDSSRYNAGWLKKLRVSYTDKGIQRQAKRAGLTAVKRESGKGQIVYEFLKA